MIDDDADLLRRFVRDRSQEAFAELTRRHVNFVYSVALRHVGGDSHSAEDVVQRVFADLARKAPSLCSHPTLAGWLFTGARLGAAQLVRAERRRHNREQKAHVMHDLSTDPAPQVDNGQLRLVLDDVVSQLNSTDREAVLLRFFEGHSFADVGARLSLSEDGARSRVDRALEKLRAMLARRQITSTGAALAAALSGQTMTAAPAGLAAAVVNGAAVSAVASSGAGILQIMATGKFVGAAAGIAALLGGLALVSTHKFSRASAPQSAPIATANGAEPGRKDSIENDLRTALAYDEGKQTARDPKRAAQWYQRAADLGAGPAEFQLGIFTETGDGLPQDYKVARGHYQRALALGVAAAGLRLGIMNLEGWGGPRDVGAAVALITQAAEGGDHPAQKVLSNMYFSGVGVKADLRQALAWQERTAKNDDPETEAAMGAILLHIYRENAQVAREWYQLSAEQDYTRGMLGMASTFFRPGSPPDQIELGMQYLDMAAKDGSSDAAFILASLYLLHPACAGEPDAPAKARDLLKEAAEAGGWGAGEVLQLASSDLSLTEALKYVLSVPEEQRYVQRFAAQRYQAEQNTSGTHPPVVLKMAKPVYPMVFRLTRTEADVVIDFIVDTTGRVRQAWAVKSPHPEFSRQALLAIKSWRFVPARKDGHLVSVHMRVPVDFRLSEIPNWIHSRRANQALAPAETVPQ